MKPDSRKNRGLLRQFPFLPEVLASRMEPHGRIACDDTTDLVINVERADGDLLYRQAHNVGLGDNSCLFHSKYPSQVMRRGEYVFAINNEGKIINRVNWPRNAEEQRAAEEETYCWTVLWGTKTGTSYTNPLWNTIKYLVWVTVTASYADTGNDDGVNGRFGEFKSRAVRVVVYQEPDGGFEKLRETSSPAKNLYLTERVLTRAAVLNHHRVISLGYRLNELCTLFQDWVYLNGMQAIFLAGEYRGASGQFGSTTILCAELCGYERVMLESPNCWVSFQLLPESQTLYVLGMGGTLPRLRDLVRGVVHTWITQPESRTNFTSDQKVSMF